MSFFKEGTRHTLKNHLDEDRHKGIDDDVQIRNWKEVIWALTTRVDAARDTLIVENTPIDYLDFASPVSGLGSKMGIDATNKWKGETTREWGTPITRDAQVVARIDAIWKDLGL